MAENEQQPHIDIAPPVEDAPVGGGQKRPAETEPDAGEEEAQQPSSKAARIADGVLPLEQQVAQLQHELEEARGEASRWRQECESLRQQLAAAQQQQQQQQQGQPNGGAAAAAEATIRSLNVQLREARSSIDQLRQAARGHVQKLQHYEHQLKQAHDRRDRDFHGPPRFPPGPPLPPPPGPGFGGPPPPPGPWGGPQHGMGMGPYGGGPGFGPQQGPPGPPPPGPQGAYYDGWGGWQQGGPAPPPQGPAGPQGGEYWAPAYPPGPGPDPAAMAAAQQPQQQPQHAPYYTQQGPVPGAADPYAQQQQQQQQQQQAHLAAAVHAQPGVPQPAAPAAMAPAPAGPQPGGGAAAAAAAPQRGPGSSGVDEEALFWELEPGKREIMDRFARSYPAMVEPSNAKSMTITDFKEMSEPQLESFFSWLSQNCNPSRPLKHPGGFVRVKHTEWKKLVERGYA